MKFPHFLPRAALCLAAGGAMFLAAWPAFAATPKNGRLPNLDRRLERLTAANAAAPAIRATGPPERNAAEATLRARLPRVQIDRDPIHGQVKWLAAYDGFLTGPNGAGRGLTAGPALRAVPMNDPHRIIKAFINEHAAIFGHDTRALQAWLGHKNIQNTVRYTQLSPQRFKDFWRD